MQTTLRRTQINNAPPDVVFPLLCPVRERDWLEEWHYDMIHSKSGLIEENCVFTTPHHGKFPTTWHVVLHDPEQFRVQFVRVTPEERQTRAACGKATDSQRHPALA